MGFTCMISTTHEAGLVHRFFQLMHDQVNRERRMRWGTTYGHCEPLALLSSMGDAGIIIIGPSLVLLDVNDGVCVGTILRDPMPIIPSDDDDDA